MTHAAEYPGSMSVRERDEEEEPDEQEIADEIEAAVERELQDKGLAQTIPTPHAGEEVANLPVQIAVAVPSTQGDQQMGKSKFEDRIEDVKRWFSETFGGATTIHASGDYVGEDGELVEEEVGVVEAAMSKSAYLENYEDFGARTENAQQSWGQDTVYYRVEDRAFIYPERAYLDDDEEVPAELIQIV